MFIAKGFDELTREELYEILRARVDVFVVEQPGGCVCGGAALSVSGAGWGGL